ncbi:hypothetical protein BAE44_0012467 [Dichanthelium oligosanthes]|uniref:MADS-box domain-containing protein n=1 Tax=Dichanthelium oligosanthes TaxID=888268 RepID=A0A1E5VN03_9POAL|nr:hypothetical protein BAE44_0012467 [Dichanthelium oligosanthes]
MPRRGRRLGVRFIEDDRDRSLTFFKWHSGLFKATSDLSTLTGMRVVVVLELENERFSSFGTPDASPIVDAFFPWDAPTEFDTSEEQKAKTTILQNEQFQLEKYKAMGNKRKKEKLARIKEMQETSRTFKYAYGCDATKVFSIGSLTSILPIASMVIHSSSSASKVRLLASKANDASITTDTTKTAVVPFGAMYSFHRATPSTTT